MHKGQNISKAIFQDVTSPKLKKDYHPNWPRSTASYRGQYCGQSVVHFLEDLHTEKIPFEIFQPV